MHPDFRAGLSAYRRGDPFDGARCSQWRQGWRAGLDGAERRSQAMSREAVENWRTANPGVTGAWDAARYRKDGPLPPARVVDLNAWITQNRHAEQTLLELRAFAHSIGCTVVGDGIECTPEQASQLERWWLDHAPPAEQGNDGT